ncbi:MAG TPA: hypothetical protein VFJ85_08040 [Acidimicrobiales bacterium]|nr:hypothetical protein [Acidimicrobiales bacterium]
MTRKEIRPPGGPAELGTALSYASYELPAGVEDFYSELNGFEVAWRSDRTGYGQPAEGSINLLPVQRIFGDWRGTVWFESAGDERFRDVKPFDLFQPEACMAFRQPPDESPEDHVQLHVFGEEVTATAYTFTDYVDRLLVSRGFSYWQTTLCDDAQETPEAKRFRDRAPALFPDIDLGLFVPR